MVAHQHIATLYPFSYLAADLKDKNIWATNCLYIFLLTLKDWCWSWISLHSFFLLPVPKREPKHGLNCSIVPGLPSLALPCCIAWYALSCTPFLHCIVLLEVCLEQRDVTEPCMHTAHKPSPKKAEMRRREKELNVIQSFPKIWAKYQCNVWGGVLVWLGLWSVFCWRASNPINHLYLALSPNLLSIQETLGERGVCLLFCYLTRLLMGQASRYPL